ncbi:MAG TPA: outer membrane protein transport protein [Chthoniobacteraceae bacterium]|nr:outer membrane protein transport protein [Chthoniobacteraceae bacterium]
MIKKLFPSLITVALLAIPSAAFGLGIRIVDQDAEATARGEAFTATADNPSAIYYNPAGITQLDGQNVLVGAYGIYLQSKYTPASGDTFRTKDQPQAVPQLFYTYSFKDAPFSLGLGIYAPYGFALQWPDNAPFRLQALQGGITFATFNPVFAWRINKTLSVAAGVNVNYARADLENGALLSSFPPNRFTFKGDGYSAGFNLGLMWQPTPQHSFGVSYHSSSNMDISGQSTAVVTPVVFQRTHASTELTFPQFIQGGYSFRPTPDWNLEADIDWADWHQLKTLTLAQAGTASAQIPFNWTGSFMYEAGATRYLPGGYRLSAGYIYSENSVPTSAFNPVVPDSNRNIFSVGLGQTKGRISWDVAYQLAYGPNRSVSNTALIDDGTYRFISHAVTFSLGYHF